MIEKIIDARDIADELGVLRLMQRHPSNVDGDGGASLLCTVRIATTASGLRVADDITQLVGETPMLQFRRLVPEGAADVFPLEDVAVVRCANFTTDDGLELAEVLGERLRFH